MSGPLLEFNCHFWVAGATKREGFVAVAKTMASVGRLKRIWTTLQLQLHYTTTTTTITITTTTTTTITTQLQLQLQLHYTTLEIERER